MPSIAIQEAFVAISAATATGELTLASNGYVFPGALAWICKDDGSARARVKVLFCSGTTKVHVRRFKNDDENSPPSYGGSDMTAFATGSHLCQESQVVPVDPAYEKRVIS